MKFLVENLKVDASDEYRPPRVTVALVLLIDSDWERAVTELGKARCENSLLVVEVERQMHGKIV